MYVYAMLTLLHRLAFNPDALHSLTLYFLIIQSSQSRFDVELPISSTNVVVSYRSK